MEWPVRRGESWESRFWGNFWKYANRKLNFWANLDSYGGLVATRFLLGLFESGCLPLFVRPQGLGTLWKR